MSFHAWSTLAHHREKSSLRSKQKIKIKRQDLRSALRLLKRHRDALPHLIQGEVPFSITAMRKREVTKESFLLMFWFQVHLALISVYIAIICLFCHLLRIIPTIWEVLEVIKDLKPWSFSFCRESTWSIWNRRKNPQEKWIFPIGLSFYFPWALFFSFSIFFL